MRAIETVRAKNPLPEGTAVVGIGLAVTGVTSYVFIGGLARVLGDVEYGGIGVLWAMVFFIGPGFFVPLEQELGRALAQRRARGLAGGTVIRRAGLLGAALAVVVSAVCVALGPWIVDELFRGEWLLLVSLVIAVFGYCVANLIKGATSGSGRFGRYSVYLGLESTLRLVVAGVLMVAGVRVAGPYGFALALSPFLAAVPVLWRQGDLLEPGPPSPWGELSVSLSALLTASVFAQLLVNAPTILIELLAGPDEKDLTGVFMVVVILARIPLFLFQAVQAALLPGLSAMAERGEYAAFRRGMARLVALLGGVAVLGTIAGFVIGPWLVQRIWSFDVAGRTVGMLALGSAVFMIAMALGQAAIALDGARWTAVAWGAGVVAFGVVVALVPGLFERVELGYVAGACVAAALMGCFLMRLIRAGAQLTDDGLREALLDLTLEA
jgi:O-antigen/teichoic acid export membrane protein